MKRKLLVPVLFLLLIAIIGGGGWYGYQQFTRLQRLEGELEVLRAEKERLQQQASTTAVEADSKSQKLTGLEHKARELDAAKAALASGGAVKILEAAVKSSKIPTAEQYLAIGAVRMITNGGSDQEATAAYERALQLSNWPSSMRLACAAQVGIAATGRAIEIPNDCDRMLAASGVVPTAVAPDSAAGQDGTKDSGVAR